MTDQELLDTARAMARQMRRQGFVDWPNVVEELVERIKQAKSPPNFKTATDAPPSVWFGPA